MQIINAHGVQLVDVVNIISFLYVYYTFLVKWYTNKE